LQKNAKDEQGQEDGKSVKIDNLPKSEDDEKSEKSLG